MNQILSSETPPPGYLQHQDVDFPCFQKYELRVEFPGPKFCVYQQTWYPNGKHFDQLFSYHFTEQEARADQTKQECLRDDRPLPPGRYQMSYFNGVRAAGLAQATAERYVRRNRTAYASEGLVPEIVQDKYNPRKLAVRGVLVVPNE